MNDEAVALLRDTLEVEMLQLMTAVNSIRYNAEGFSILRSVAQAAWDNVSPEDKAERHRRTDEFMEQCGNAMAAAIARRMADLHGPN